MRLIPEDKRITPEMLAALRRRGERRVYRGAQRFAIGMPCGGVAAGQLYVLGDGTLGGWHVDGRINETGYGATSYKMRPQPRELVQGFTVLVKRPDGGGTGMPWIEARLADGERGGSFDHIEFIGEYPVAEVRYGKSREAAFPLEVTLRCGSPFVPLNAKDSTLPCTVMRFRLSNTSERAVSGHLVGYLENGIDKPEPGEAPARRRNRAVAKNGFATVLMEVVPRGEEPNARPDRMLFDFEGSDYAGWEVKGTAFGAGPSRGTFRTQQKVSGFEGLGLVNTYADDDNLVGEIFSEPFTIDRRFLTFLIGGGSHSKRTCMNLLVDGKVVLSATGRNEEALAARAWDVRAWEGKQARVHIVDAQKGPWGHINADAVRLVDRLPEGLRRPSPGSLTFGTLALSGEGRPLVRVGDVTRIGETRFAEEGQIASAESDESEGLIGAIDSPFELKPGESREIAFIVSWHFPNLHTGQGVMYANWFGDAAEVAGYVHENFERLMRETDLFRKTWYEDTTLPWWLALRLFMPTANLATGTAQWWKNGRFWGWEGVGCCHGTCTHVWNYSHAEARLFPELARSTRVMQDLGTGFEEATGRVAFRGEVDKGFEYAGDGQSGTVLKCYREHLCSVDDAWLKANWTRIRKVLEYQIERDRASRAAGGAAGEPDGIIEATQHNTFDINFEGPNTFVGSLYLASLLAGARMAEAVGDAESAARYRGIARRGREYSERRLFENGYFVQRIPEDASDRWQYGKGCLTDQLFGQNWARCLGLGTVYDEEKVRSGLRAVYRYNFAPAVGQYNSKYPPERWFAEGREGGLFVCTWPMGGRAGEPVRYRDEVWTGCEYQAAGGMAWEGLVDEALVIVNAIDQRYDGTAHNPWNEVECGDHYARAMASYGVFQALCGFSLDGPAGEIGLAPRLNPEMFAAYFAGPQGWGLATQVRHARSQQLEFEVRWGTLRVRTVTAEIPAAWEGVSADVHLAGRSAAAALSRDGAKVRVVLNEAGDLKAGETLKVTFAAER